MDILERNNCVLEKLDSIVKKLWENTDNINSELIQCMKSLNEVLKEFIGRIDEFRGYGVEVPENIILTQMKNLMEGFEKGDSILLADTMEYEIRNTILFYNDILTELAKEQV